MIHNLFSLLPPVLEPPNFFLNPPESCLRVLSNSRKRSTITFSVEKKQCYFLGFPLDIHLKKQRGGGGGEETTRGWGGGVEETMGEILKLLNCKLQKKTFFVLIR